MNAAIFTFQIIPPIIPIIVAGGSQNQKLTTYHAQLGSCSGRI